MDVRLEDFVVDQSHDMELVVDQSHDGLDMGLSDGFSQRHLISKGVVNETAI